MVLPALFLRRPCVARRLALSLLAGLAVWLAADPALAGILTERRLLELIADPAGQPPESPGSFRFVRAAVEGGRARLVYELPGPARLEILLVPSTDPQPAYAATRSFKLYYLSGPDRNQNAAPHVGRAIEAVSARLRQSDRGGWTFPHAAAAGFGSSGRTLSPVDALKFGFGQLLLLLCLLGLPLVVWATVRQVNRLPRPAARAVWLLILAAGGLRLLVAPRLVITMYMGFLLTGQAAVPDELFRYGVGAQALWNGLFTLIRPDHAAVATLHAALGTANLALLAAVSVRAGFRPLGTALLVLLAGGLPLLVWSDVSDSLSVPALFFTLGATVLAGEALDRRGDWRLLAPTVVWLGLAGHVRPEQLFFGPLLLLTLALPAPGRMPNAGLPLPHWLGAAGLYGLIGLPQAVHAVQQRALLIARDSWPHELWQVLPDVPRNLTDPQLFVMIDPRMVPLALLPLGLLGLLIARSRQVRTWRLALFATGFVWLVFYYIDLSLASAPRLHVVLALPCALIAADMLADLWAWRPRRWFWPGPLLALAGLALLAAGVPSTVAWLWQPTNEREEEGFFREAAGRLPDGVPFLLVHYGGGDGEPGIHTHPHHPDYLVRPPWRTGSTISIGEFLKRDRPADLPVYWYRGMRCYSRARTPAEPPPQRYFNAACQRLETACRLEPVTVRRVVNHGDVALKYYPSQPEFELGLFRLRDCATSSGGAAGPRAAPPPEQPEGDHGQPGAEQHRQLPDDP